MLAAVTPGWNSILRTTLEVSTMDSVLPPVTLTVSVGSARVYTYLTANEARALAALLVEAADGCPVCHGTGEIQINETSDPQTADYARCPERCE